jgi:hypothetical protein
MGRCWVHDENQQGMRISPRKMMYNADFHQEFGFIGFMDELCQQSWFLTPITLGSK